MVLNGLTPVFPAFTQWRPSLILGEVPLSSMMFQHIFRFTRDFPVFSLSRQHLQYDDPINTLCIRNIDLEILMNLQDIHDKSCLFPHPQPAFSSTQHNLCPPNTAAQPPSEVIMFVSLLENVLAQVLRAAISSQASRFVDNLSRVTFPLVAPGSMGWG